VNSLHPSPPQMVFFTTPGLLEIGGVPFVSPYDKPTRIEALRYYRKVRDQFDLQVAYGETVTALTREPHDGHDADAASDHVLVVETRSKRGVRVRHAHNVILAIGYFDQPNLLGIPGEDLPHVSHFYSEPHP